jgi:TolB-like protein
MSLLAELKRRNVIRVAAAYAVLCWLVLQVGDILIDSLDLSGDYSKFIIILLALGFIPVLVFSWIYEMTPEGIKKESDIDRADSVAAHTAKKLDLAVIVLLILAMGMFALDRLVPGGGRDDRAEPVPVPVTQTATPAPIEEPAEKSLDSSVAVLPFSTRSLKEEDVFFSDGVHDDLLTQLSKIGDLKVISRTSVMEYRDTTKRIPDIADELGVATVVEGAVQRSGSMVRITAQLIDAETDEHLWANTYDRELTAENLFSIQTEIATSIATALEATLSPEESAALERRLTHDLEAAAAYRRARWLSVQFEIGAVDAAVDQLEFALERDPAFAAAWSMMARAHLARVWFWNGGDESRAAALEAIERGRKMDPSLPEHDIAEGYYHYWGHFDYAAALEVLRPVIERFPNDAELHQVLGWIHRRAGNYEQSIIHQELALELNPRASILAVSLAGTYVRLRDYAQADVWVNKTLEMEPASTGGQAWKAQLLEQRGGDLAGAWRWWQQMAHKSYSRNGQAAWRNRVAAGDYETALSIADLGDGQFTADGSFPVELLNGLTFLYMGNQNTAQTNLLAARSIIETRIEQLGPGYHDLGALCWIDGGLGNESLAVENCHKYLERVPPDQFEAANFWQTAAIGLALGGAEDEALDLVEKNLSARAGHSWHRVDFEPAFRGLHEHPRWKALEADHGGAQ